MGHESSTKTPPPAAHPAGAPPYRHEPFVLVQALLVGGDEEPPVLHPARVQPRLGRQLPADHIPGVRQQLHLHIAGTQLPQETCGGHAQGGTEDVSPLCHPRRDAEGGPRVRRVSRVTLRGSCSISWICGNATKHRFLFWLVVKWMGGKEFWSGWTPKVDKILYFYIYILKFKYIL